MTRSRRRAQTGPSRRTQLLIAAGVAVVAVILLIGVASLLRNQQGQGSGDAATGSEPQAPVERNVMGSASAPLVLAEYSDFQ